MFLLIRDDGNFKMVFYFKYIFSKQHYNVLIKCLEYNAFKNKIRRNWVFPHKYVKRNGTALRNNRFLKMRDKLHFWLIYFQSKSNKKLKYLVVKKNNYFTLINLKCYIRFEIINWWRYELMSAFTYFLTFIFLIKRS